MRGRGPRTGRTRWSRARVTSCGSGGWPSWPGSATATGTRRCQLALQLPGALDRDAAVAEVVARLGAARSAWNAADVRGEVEQLLARDRDRRRRGGADRVGRGPHRPRGRALRAAARAGDTRTRPRAHLPARARRRGRPRRPARRPRAARPGDLGRRSAGGRGVGRGSAGRGRRAGRRRGTGRGRGRGRRRQDHHPRRDPGRVGRAASTTGRGDTDVEGGAGRHRRGGCPGRVGGVAGLAARLALG